MPGRVSRALARVEANEIQAVLLSFLMVFILMAAYFMLRPVRDAMASDWSREEVGVLWTMTFFASLFAVIAYGFVISRIPFHRVVPSVYAFFSVSFFAFYLNAGVGSDAELVRQVFYVWVSLFALFNTSVFWSFMSGLYNKEQAPRLFAIVATGASLGALAGSRFVNAFVADIGALNMMPIAAGLLLLVLLIVPRLEFLKSNQLGNADLSADLSEQIKLSKNPFSGIGILFSNRFLLGIGAFIFLYVLMGTFFYQALREGLAPLELEQRAVVRSGIDFWVNLGAFLIGIFVTGRVASRFGMAATLAVIPLLLAGGWLLVAAAPLLPVLIGMDVGRKIGNYAVTRPGREMLFTAVDEETRYKAKPVVDIVVYRGGDVVNVLVLQFPHRRVGVGNGACRRCGRGQRTFARVGWDCRTLG